MKYLVPILLLLTGCYAHIPSKVTLEAEPIDGEVRFVNPIIEFCERLHPEILYPNEYIRESMIVQCMASCVESGNCGVPNLGE